MHWDWVTINGDERLMSGTFMAIMDLTGVAAFLELVKTGSVLAAAKNLKVSRATLRRRIEAIEEGIGRPLFERQRDDLVLTRAGRLLEREGALLLGSARRLEKALEQVGSETVSGTLSVAMPTGLPGPLVALFTRELAEQWPNLHVVATHAEDPLAELDRDADVAITSGPRPPTPWLARSIANLEERAYVHDDYIARAGVPRVLADLRKHRLLSWHAPDRAATQWPLRTGGTVRVQPALISNDLRSVQECILAGLGIGVVALPPRLPGIRAALPGVLGGRRRFWLASAAAGRWSPSVHAFGQHLVTFLRANIEQEEVPSA